MLVPCRWQCHRVLPGLDHGSHLPRVLQPWCWGHSRERGWIMGHGRNLVGTVHRAQALEPGGLGTVRQGCSTSGWT